MEHDISYVDILQKTVKEATRKQPRLHAIHLADFKEKVKIKQ